MLRPIRVVSAALYLSVCSHARVLGYFQSHSRKPQGLDRESIFIPRALLSSEHKYAPPEERLLRSGAC